MTNDYSAFSIITQHSFCYKTFVFPGIGTG